MKKRSLRDIDVAGKRVLVRVDFNVPLDRDSGAITDDSRIRAALPTIRYLTERGATVVLCSHLGRPKGRPDPKLSLAPVAARLDEILGSPVPLASGCVGDAVEAEVAAAPPGGVLLLENLRFHAEEEANDPTFAKALASLADVYVNDAFGAAHRAHASTEGVTRYLPSSAGFLLEQELDALGGIVESPERPLAAVSGGAKVSDKLALLEHMVEKVDVMIVGGGMCATFFKARGYEIGDSLLEPEMIDAAAGIERRAAERGVSLLLPEDVVVADRFAADACAKTVAATEIEPGWMLLDVGPRALASFGAALRPCRTVVWNGPMGVFEMPRFAAGTKGMAEIVAGLDATTVLGGGSTAQAVYELGLADRVTHVSTGGGASLELLEGKTLPGVAALPDQST